MPVATVRAGPGFWGSMDTDEPLIAALADDLDASFEALALAHQDRMYSIALRMLGDPRDAEEAAQDALVRAYRALAEYDAARIQALRLRPWLATIVLNLCRSRLARRPAAAGSVVGGFSSSKSQLNGSAGVARRGMGGSEGSRPGACGGVPTALGSSGRAARAGRTTTRSPLSA